MGTELAPLQSPQVAVAMASGVLAPRGELLDVPLAARKKRCMSTANQHSAQTSATAPSEKPCAFFDRDGVLNYDLGYTYRLEDLRWQPGAKDAIKRLNNAGYLVVVVTNQAGIARGFYTEEHMHAFHKSMQADLAKIGAHIDAIYFCPFHPEGSVERYRIADHPDRKPNPGMILRAMRDLSIQREGSFLIGDRESDLAAAATAGLPHALYSGGDLDALVRDMVLLHQTR